MKTQWWTYPSDTRVDCPRCQGRGVVRDPLKGGRKTCPKCGGSKTVQVEIIEGVEVAA